MAESAIQFQQVDMTEPVAVGQCVRNEIPNTIRQKEPTK
jgi:hypothetical protein